MSSTSIRGRSVLVTGGCGFIGQHLVRALLAGGAREVVVLDSLRFGDPGHLAGLENVRVIRFALGHDPSEALVTHLAAVDLVFHLAAEKHNASRADPQSLLASNVGGTLALLEAASAAGARKVVLASSLYAYGRRHAPVLQEDEIALPDTVYGISKLAGEHLLRHAARAHGLSWLALRYFFVYGPGQYPGLGYKSVIVRTFERLQRGEQATVYGDGRQVLDYVYVDDVVEATILAMESESSGEVLNVGSGEPTEIRALLARMAEICGGNPELVNHAPDETAGTFRVADIRKAQERLGWSPRTPLERGLLRTILFLREGERA